MTDAARISDLERQLAESERAREALQRRIVELSEELREALQRRIVELTKPK